MGEVFVSVEQKYCKNSQFQWFVCQSHAPVPTVVLTYQKYHQTQCKNLENAKTNVVPAFYAAQTIDMPVIQYFISMTKCIPMV